MPPMPTPAKDPRHKAAWKFTRDVAQLLIQAGATIFGGAVRDMILHDAHSTDFYEHLLVTEEDDDDNALYEDAAFLPKAYGRHILPSDIDLAISSAGLPNLLEALRKGSYNVKSIFMSEPAYFQNMGVNDGDFRHHRFLVRMLPPNVTNFMTRYMCAHIPSLVHREMWPILQSLRPELEALEARQPTVLVDIMEMRTNTCPMPYAKPDFMCNGLVWDAAGIRVAPSIQGTGKHTPFAVYKQLQGIIDDILHRVARPCLSAKIMPYRAQRLMTRGWKIMPYNVVLEDAAATTEDACIICHESVVPAKAVPSPDPIHHSHIKMKCCSARMHDVCFLKACTKGPAAMFLTQKCLMCRSSRNAVDQDAYIVEARVLMKTTEAAMSTATAAEAAIALAQAQSMEEVD